MSAAAEPAQGELQELKDRVRLLARQKAHVELINQLLVGLSSVAGLENLVPKVLTLVMGTVGGSNVAIYHVRKDRWYYTDIYGTQWDAETLEDPLVAEAVWQERLVRATAPEAESYDEKWRWETWVFPLRAHNRPVGALRLEGMQVAGHDIVQDLNPFLVYVSLMLHHEISNYSTLEAAHERLLRKNQALEQEIAARKEAEHRYRAIVEHSPDGIMVLDPADGGILQFNEAAHARLGYTHAEFSRLTLGELNCDGRRDLLERVLVQGEDSSEIRLRTKAGAQREMQLRLRLIEFSGRTMVHCMTHDVTDSNLLEKEILKAQKLESVGLLAGGIAHDFNNLLTSIMGNVSLAIFLSQPGDKLQKLLHNAEKAAQRAGDLTQQLLTFAKGGAPVKRLTSMGDVVRESASFAVRGSNVRCEFRIAEDLWPCEADPGQISQVINNLVINADQAMPAGGLIRINCRNSVVKEGGPLPLPAGRYLKIAVADQGEGIAQEIVSRIFDPYFTTKEHGTGLGLATSYSVLKRHGGLISVESEPGRGTTFTLHLPALDTTPPEQAAEEAPVLGCHEKVLVMDDEELVLEVACEMLTSLGYHVSAAVDGVQALEMYRLAASEGAPFAAVIMDLTVPAGMGGKEALQHLLKLDPHARAIVSSGYSNDPVMARYADFGFGGVLVKPYRTEDLSKVLGQVLASPLPSPA